MKAKVEHNFAISKEALIELYASREFYEERFEIDGIDDYVITRFEEKAGKTHIGIERDIVIRTDNLPGFAKKIAKNLAGDSTTVATAMKWDKDKGTGVNTIKSGNVPISATIKFNILEKSATECVTEAEIEISAKIPLVGKRLEKFILPIGEKGLKKDLQKADDYVQAM